MASTRQQPSFQIFQDYSEPASQPQPPTSATQSSKPRPQLQPSAMPLQPMRNAPLHQQQQQQYSAPEVIISPPMSAPQQMSPLKSQHFSPQEHDYSHLQYVPVPVPEQNGMYTDSPLKKAAMHPPQQFHPPRMAPQPMFTTFNSNFETFEPENYSLPPSMQDNFVEFPEPAFARRSTLKRSFSDAVSSDRPVKRAKHEESDSITEIPEPGEMPAIEDEGGKPPFSYAQMIGMAILRAPNRRLTLAQIYEWISTTFKHYREDPKQGWHNSIRHNLSLNKAFRKQERPKGDAGKGCYWVIQPGMELPFVKDKSRKSGNMHNMTMQQTLARQNMQSMAPPLVDAMAPKQWIIHSTPEQSHVLHRPLPPPGPALPELSSDATLPASDPALNDDDVTAAVVACGENVDNAAHSMPPPSSPTHMLNSSPPIAVSKHQRTISSPMQRPRQPMGRGHKRGANTVDDSGYFSSLESSVRRQPKSGVILTSEIDLERPKKNRGRAEEEIARIRSSSIDLTPSHRRFQNAASDNLHSSSPIGPSPVVRLHPTTPSVVFKKPMRPPPSISPNTQLRYHRAAMQEFMDSPARNNVFTGGVDFDAYSPAFKLVTPVVPSTFDEHFQVYYDTAQPGTPFDSSPLKMPTKRASATRPNTSIGVLSDATSRANKLNSIKSPSKAPKLKAPVTASYTGSPLKTSVPAGGYTNDENEELFDFGSFGDENSEGEGFDITQGFAKIGGAGDNTGSHGTGSRPAFGRSFTSCF